MTKPWIDLHCHLDKLEEGVESALEEAAKAGVNHMVTIGTEPKDHPVVVALAEKYFPRVACTLGVHPHEATLFDESAEVFMQNHLPEPYVVAVAEIGLDYYYNHSPKEAQMRAFVRQMEMAEDHGLPVQIHTRDAEEDTIKVLNQFRGRVKGVIHCFTGTKSLAESALDAGFDLSISGVITFKKADELRETVRSVPLDRLHVETDSPYLAPVPMRGKSNTPAYVLHTAQRLAELKGVSVDELQSAVLANAKRVFSKLQLG